MYHGIASLQASIKSLAIGLGTLQASHQRLEQRGLGSADVDVLQRLEAQVKHAVSESRAACATVAEAVDRKIAEAVDRKVAEAIVPPAESPVPPIAESPVAETPVPPVAEAPVKKATAIKGGGRGRRSNAATIVVA